jgi:acyl-CoA thioester hydrolase
MAGIPIYQTAILPEWIDYNGHLRDAYYGLIVSLATDALMDRVGLDAAYRARTGCTLYTVEMHIHFLREVKQTDTVGVSVRIAGADTKRVHAAFEIAPSVQSDVAATAELMLLHVRQHGDTVSTTAFPPVVSAALAQLQQESAGMPAGGPGSRQMALRGNSRAP